MVNLLAHAAAGVENPFYDAILYAGSAYNLFPTPLDLHSLVHPAPTDYYLNPGTVPGCDDIVQPECGTIFEALYRPILSLPSQIASLQGAWNTCVPVIFGVYDPPTALTQVSTIAGVSLPAQTTTSDQQQTTSTGGATQGQTTVSRDPRQLRHSRRAYQPVFQPVMPLRIMALPRPASLLRPPKFLPLPMSLPPTPLPLPTLLPLPMLRPLPMFLRPMALHPKLQIHSKLPTPLVR